MERTKPEIVGRKIAHHPLPFKLQLLFRKISYHHGRPWEVITGLWSISIGSMISAVSALFDLKRAINVPNQLYYSHMMGSWLGKHRLQFAGVPIALRHAIDSLQLWRKVVCGGRREYESLPVCLIIFCLGSKPFRTSDNSSMYICMYAYM